jgi:hypothetical protein
VLQDARMKDWAVAIFGIVSLGGQSQKVAIWEIFRWQKISQIAVLAK